MPRITEELVRSRAEHNNRDITTLEELSLHQQEIERIEHLDRWCRDLKILYLQNNLIPKIENVGRLKQLQYLNLALNNVEKIENLEGCEFLEKLDLTVNFVGDLFSLESLRSNRHLRELYLTGNPCTDYEGYRDFVVATLPQLRWLDGKEVSKSERILATQKYDELRRKIMEQQKLYQVKREKEKREYEMKQQIQKKKKPGFDGNWYTDPNAHLQQNTAESEASASAGDDGVRSEGVRSEGADGEGRGVRDDESGTDEEEERFQNEPVPFTPESRTEAHNYIAEKRKDKKESSARGPDPPKRQRRLEMDGRMLNVNEGKYDFHLQEDTENCQYILEVDCPRFMDTSLMDCDVQPTYVRITMKGKVLQLVLQEEVSPDKSSAKRSQTTGKLLITMPKANPVIRPKTKHHVPDSKLVSKREPDQDRLGNGSSHSNGRQLLEVDPSLSRKADIHNIVPAEGSEAAAPIDRPRWAGSQTGVVEEVTPSEGFVDDPDVPPLI